MHDTGRQLWWCQIINILRPRQKGHHITDDIFKCPFLNKNVWIQIEISLRSIPKDPISNISALLKIMARRRPGDKPLCKPMMVSLLMHTCISLCPNQLSTLTHSLWWRHNGRDSFLNHQPRDCLLNRLFRLTSKKTSKFRGTGLCAGNSPGPVNSPHRWPVTRKMFPFDDVIMYFSQSIRLVLQMLAPLAAYRVPAGKLWQLTNKCFFYFGHKTQYL